MSVNEISQWRANGICKLKLSDITVKIKLRFTKSYKPNYFELIICYVKNTKHNAAPSDVKL